jgi:Lrp/AsnC family transcriptional regulator, leucine-responsive regulatory protein
MDKIDNLLMTELRRDARAPIVALARAIGLSRSATQSRIKRLIDHGLIRGFTIIEGQHTAQTAHLLVKLKSGFKCASFTPKLKRLSGIVRIHSVTGTSDILIQCDAAAIDDIGSIRSAIVEMDGIDTVITMIVLERHLN